jgi:hypothetical protein
VSRGRRQLVIAAAVVLSAIVAVPAAGAAPTARSFGGTLEIRHTDDFKHGRSTTRYQLVSRGRRIPLVLARPPQVLSGAAVVVRGRRVGSRLKGSLRPVNGARAKLSATYVARPHKTAVILVKFDSSSPPWTPDYVRQRVFTDPDSTNAYYQEDSYGDISLVGKNRADGDVYGWYTIPAPIADANYGCDPDAIASNADIAAAADGFDATGYDHVNYAFPWQSMCGWAGLGEMPGTRSWINGYVDQVDVVAHELGHNMGLHHASSLSCTDGGTPVAIGPNCTSSEYGDPFDVMGGSSRRNNAWHLAQIGFMPASNVQVVNGDGTYTLSATSARGGTRLLRVPRPPGASPPYYDLELRATNGVFDDFLSNDPVVQGVTIHTDPETSVLARSELIDTTPGSFWGFADAPLAVGRTFSDGTVSITLQSIAGDQATLQVTTGTAPQDVTPPTVPGPVTAVASSDGVELSWPAASDDIGVAGYRIYRGSTQVATTTSALTWTDAVVTPGNTYTYRVAAFDAAGHASTSASVSVTVPTPAATTTTDPGPSTDPLPGSTQPPVTKPPTSDLTPPLVRIKSPSRSSRLHRRASVSAVARDNVRVVRTEIWIDLKRRKSVRGATVSWRWVLRHVRRGRHVIAVRAIDSSGNEGTATVRPFVVR